MKTIGQTVLEAKENKNEEGLYSLFCGLNGDLKNNHSNHMCITKVDMTSRIDENSKSFMDTIKVSTSQDIKDDLEEYAITYVNAFVFLNSDSNSFIPLNRNNIITNWESISFMITKATINDNYPFDILSGKAMAYYDDYIKTLDNNNGYAHSNHLSKSTPAGRAFSDKSLDGAFVNIMFYPVVIASVSILLAVIYVTVSLLIK